MKSPISVWIVPEYPECLMSGGLQVQATETARALREADLGVDVELFEWSSKKPIPDLVHFVGFPGFMSSIAVLVRQAGCPYVITKLMGGNRGAFHCRISFIKSRLKAACGVLPTMARSLCDAGRVVAITTDEALAIKRTFGIREDQIAVVPHGVSKKFNLATSVEWEREFGRTPFILTVGAVQRRKNQTILVEAANRLRLPVVVLGPVLPGESQYADSLERAMNTNIDFGGRWIKNLKNDDPLLHSAYAACRVFCLLSSSETQPLSVLQAMAVGSPTLILQAVYATQEPFNRLERVPNLNFDLVVGELEKFWISPKAVRLGGDYSWESVATKLADIYRSVLAGSNR